MKIRFFSEADDWTENVAKINTRENLDAIRRTLQDVGPIIVEHWFYRGARAPSRVVFDDFDDFEEYLTSKASAGDAIHIWSFSASCTQQNKLVSGKCPDDRGRVPKRGAY